MVQKNRILKCFNAKADTYESAADVQVYVAQQLAGCLEGVQAQRILEIGCGTGHFSQYLVDKYPDAELVLTDIAPAMVAVTAQRFSTNGNVRVMSMDGENFNLSQSFDLIVSSMAMHWFADLKASLKQLMKQLSSNGKLVVSFLGSNSLLQWRQVFQELNMSVPTPHFPQEMELNKFHPELNFEKEMAVYQYQNSFQFLKTLKKLGAHASRAEHAILSSAELRRVMKHFDKKSGSTVEIPYEIIYGSYTKA